MLVLQRVHPDITAGESNHPQNPQGSSTLVFVLGFVKLTVSLGEPDSGELNSLHSRLPVVAFVNRWASMRTQASWVTFTAPVARSVFVES